jgi:hypothetical protein
MNMRWRLVLLALALSLSGCGNDLDTFQGLVKELDEAEQEIRSRQEEVRARIQQYNAEHPDRPIDASSMDRLVMGKEQAEELSRLLGEEKDVSYKGLVQEIIEGREQIDQLQERVRLLQESLPAPYTVQRGDTHLGVAMNYLMQNHGLSSQEARSVIEKTALVEEIHEGFQIWMLYKDGVFGTYVTQGSAKISPGRAQRLARQRIEQKMTTLTEERDTAQSSSDSLQELHDSLQERILFLRSEESRLVSEISALRESRDQALARAAMEETQRRDLERRLNSLYYEAASMDAWKQRKVISDPLFGGPRVQSLNNVTFPMTHDLRESQILTFEASMFPELKKIKKIDVFPRNFREDNDFAVAFEADGNRAVIRILRPDAFAGQKVIFALR